MAGVWGWYAGLTEQEKFDLIKIVFEKGLLAAIVGIASIVIAVLLERYKSTLKRQEELSKFIMPQIGGTLDDAEILFQDGVTAIGALQKQAASCAAWAVALSQSPAVIETGNFDGTAVDLKREIIRFEGRMISAEDLLDRTAPDDLARSLLRHPDFAKERKRLIDGDFLYALHQVLTNKPGTRIDSTLTLFLAKCVYERLAPGPRNEYSERVNKFALGIMRRLPAETPRQRRAWEGLHEVLSNMRAIINRYPTGMLVKLENDQPPFDRLALCHAVLVARLRGFLNAD
jgi:hypothetical protein